MIRYTLSNAYCRISRPRVKWACESLRRIGAAGVLMTVLGCAAIDLKNPWDRYYDPNDGTGKEAIEEHFNLHRGHWWNHYARGSLYLACGHYAEAKTDLEEARTRRDRDQRDARTYGMHFMDYFPHRELGVTYYFLGKSDADRTVKAELLGRAVEELETSLRQEQSARAKFYLNRARSEYWQTTREDTTPPVIRVQKPIYARGGTVRFEVTATDDQSHVGEIRIARSAGNIEIRTPVIVPELAEQKVTETAEIALAPREKMAVIIVRALDLAGNESEPDSTLIIVDTEAPTAIFNVGGRTPGPQGAVAVSVEARDNFGLRYIQVGEDPRRRIDCDGAMHYAGAVAGTPRDGELAVMLVDNAGNEVLVGLPVRGESGTATLVPGPWPRTSWVFLLAGATPARNWARPWSPESISRPSARSEEYLSPITRAQTASLVDVPGDRGDGYRPQFSWPVHVRTRKARPKETSQDTFILEGVASNCEYVDEIAVYVNQRRQWRMELKKAAPAMVYTLHNEIPLAPFGVGKVVTIDVNAYCTRYGSQECLRGERLEVVKCDDCRREPDSVYGLLLLPVQLRPEVCVTGTPLDSRRNSGELLEVHQRLLEALGGLTVSKQTCLDSSSTSDSGGKDTQRRFRVYDLSQLYGQTTWYEVCRPEDVKGIVLHDLRKWRPDDGKHKQGQINPNGVDPGLIDLVVSAEFLVYAAKSEGGEFEEQFQMRLQATPVRDGPMTVHVKTWPRPLNVRPEAYCTNIESACRQVTDEMAKCLPRYEAPIIAVDGSKCRMRIGLVPEKLIEGAGVWLYSRDTPKNARLRKICCGSLDSVDARGSWIRPEDTRGCLLADVGDLVVTK